MTEMITIDRTVMELALEALEGCRIEYDYHGNPMDASDRDVIEARSALRTAIKQTQSPAEQYLGMVPPGWKLVPVEPTRDMIAAAAKDESSKEHPTYASMYAAMLDAAPQPERQPLTDEQILEVMREWPVETNVWADHIDFARAIERAHGIGGEE